ncbi:MAG: response regulator [Gemmatimonadetes bacterium]|nr:response regulator [Gemmatimonadota bacterium]
MTSPKPPSQRRGSPQAHASWAGSNAPLGRRLTVLVVDDEISVRRLAARALGRAGYRVLEAEGGDQAIFLSEQHDGPIDVVLADVVMPSVSGPELVEYLRQARPDLAAVYMSGYTEHSIAQQKSPGRSALLLAKPFTIEELLGKVRAALEGLAERSEGGEGGLTG